MKRFLAFLTCAALLLACGKDPQEQPAPSPSAEVASVRVDPQSATLSVGETLPLSVTVLPANAANQAVSWSSNQPGIATVSPEGLVTAVGPGIASIKASAGGKTGVCVVTVSENRVEVTGVVLDCSALSLAIGEEATLTATVSPANATDPTLSWKSDHPEVAMVDSQGRVMALEEGETTITVTAGACSASCQVTVYKAEIAVASITLSTQEIALARGETAKLVATVLPENASDRSVSWSSSDPLIASVDASGWVSAHAQGEAVITARAGDQSATCKVTVTVPLESLSLDRASVSLRVGETVQLNATLYPADASQQALVWSCDPEGVVSVNQNGLVMALVKGSAKVTVACSGKSASCLVTVTDDITGGNEDIGYDQD